jgi:UDP-glucose 4-epimerase
MAKILVTGASGYIGSYLCQYLAEQGHAVTASARKLTASLELALPRCSLLELDVLAVSEGLRGDWDCIIHTATANDIVSRQFTAGVDLSVKGTQQVLELAHRSSVAHVIFFSTLQVYGIELEGQIAEDRLPTPENAYGLNHLLGEETCRLAARQRGLVTSLLRPANVYGCPASATVDRWTLVPMCFVREALTEGTITLRSSGLQRRDFVSLRLLSQACATLVSQQPQHTQAYNVGTGHTLSMLEVASLVQEVTHQQTGVKPELRVMSPEPRTANSFSLASSIVSRPTPTACLSEMKEEVSKMLHYFSQT